MSRSDTTIAWARLALHRAGGHRRAEAATLDSLAVAHHHLGDHDAVDGCAARAPAMFRELGHRPGEADVLTHLGGCRAGQIRRCASGGRP